VLPCVVGKMFVEVNINIEGDNGFRARRLGNWLDVSSLHNRCVIKTPEVKGEGQLLVKKSIKDQMHETQLST